MQHIYEESNITVRARIKSGVAKSTDVKFVFKRGEEILETVDAAFATGTPEGEEGWVEAKLQVPLVEDDKESYVLSYEVHFAEEVRKDFGTFTVWPKKASLKVVDVDEETKALPGFRFKLNQGGEQIGEPKTTGDNGEVEVALERGMPFSFTDEPPYVIKEWVTETGRKREAKGKVEFEACFVTPTKGEIKQFVNVATTDSGRDGKGYVVKIKVGVKGDADRPTKLGAAGMKVHVRVTFGPGTGGPYEKSARTDAAHKTEIKDELGFKKASGPTDNVTTGAVEFGDDGTGELQVHLGLAGGDTCKIEIAGTDSFLKNASTDPDETLTFTNWRKLYYELTAPDFYAARELEQVDVPGKGMRYDYPAAGRTQLKAAGDSVFIEFALADSHIFTEGDAPAGTVLSKRFLGLSTSEIDKAMVLTDYTMGKLATGVAWDRSKAPVCLYIKLCDANYYWERDRTVPNWPHGRVRVSQSAEAKRHEVPVYDAFRGYFIPVSGYGQGAGEYSFYLPDTTQTQGIRWKAKVTADQHKTDVTLAVVAQRYDAAKESRTVTVRETNQDVSHDIVYANPKLGNIPTSLTREQQTALETWIEARFAPDVLRANGNAIEMEVKALQGSKRRDKRYQAVVDVVEAKVRALANTHKIAVHPGLDDNETPREGVLGFGDIDMTRSTTKKIVLTLPDGPGEPGSFVGAAETATECQVKIDFYLEPHPSALGLCENQDVLCVFHKANAAGDLCTSLHEIGHALKLAVFTNSDTVPAGIPTPKKITRTEVAKYRLNGVKGHMYDRHDHSGSHCAYGLSDAQKGEASYQQRALHAAARCLMFGAGGVVRPFCPQCQDILRARHLDAVPPS